MMTKYLRIINLVIVCLAVGYLSSKVTQASIETWYPLIKKPVFNPPNWVFAPVWTLLFILMGISGGLIWNQMATKMPLVKKGMLFFIIQLALNALWSYIFFINPIFSLGWICYYFNGQYFLVEPIKFYFPIVSATINPPVQAF